jgi:uncharacterized protein (DUF305 family)
LTKVLAVLALLAATVLGVVGTSVYAQNTSPSPTPMVDTDTNDDGDMDVGEDNDGKGGTSPSGAPQTGFGTLR